MSLLMEALRKAEEAKRRMQQEEQAAVAARDSGEVADAAPTAQPTQNNPASAFTLEDREDLTPEYIRDNFTTAQSRIDESPREEPPAAAAVEPLPEPEPEPVARNLARRKQRAAAASVFDAKKSPARNRKTVTILVIVMVLMIPLGGGVLWYLQSAESSSLINPALANYDLSSRSFDTPAPAAAPPALPPASTDATGAAAEPQTITAETTATPAAVEAPEGAVGTDTVATTETDEATVPPAPEATPALVAETAAETPAPVPPVPLPNALAGVPAEASPAEATEPVGVLEISRTRATRQINPDLVAAYESLQSGDLASSARLYQQVMDASPNNRDAMLGLALIRQRENSPVAARDLYARLLQLNPRDALAQTGLLQTMQITEPSEHESALKALISQYPDVAQLTLALGNLYASQQRWSEAQGAYYNALLIASRNTGGPVNPDYAFNLAVSLEQLDEPRAALEYYRQAQALARQVTPGFDLEQLNSRLAHLEQAQP